ncbi:FAD binding domain-containing protein [Xylariomycetidae sp. FL0641]|nr:FAD binding domain-containing protein [Xylariomycetidae sp. FL0641]
MARMTTTTVGALLAAALAATAVADTCETVNSQTDIATYKNLELEYTSSQIDYWSTSCGALKPSCIIEPTTTAEMAAVVAILNQNNETFAVKSGGHNPNNYFASVDGGPLLSTKQLNEIVFDPATETVRVGPGNRWEDLSGALDGTGYSAVGGRIGNVGVGGYMLGGGLSFMSSEFGFAANSVVEVTMVLANASVVTVSETNYPDLFMAIRGGGNNFGIITSYVLQTYPMGDIWGGNLFYEANEENNVKMLAAIRDFTEYYPDEKAAVIVTAERTLANLVDIWVLFLYYNGAEPPAGVFDNFTAIPHIADTTKTQTYNELLGGNNWAVVKGSVYTIGTETLPLPSAEDGPEVMGALFDSWWNHADQAQWVGGSIASIAFQPIPRRVARQAAAKGGDMLDLDQDVDRIFIELDYSFLLNADYDKVDQIMRDTYTGLRGVVQDCQANGTMPADVYLPLFQNDCFYPQDYWGRLRPEKLALAQQVQADVDPDGFWAGRTGGFKIPQA